MRALTDLAVLVALCGFLLLALSLTGCATTGSGDAWKDVGKVLLEVGGAAADLSLFFLP